MPYSIKKIAYLEILREGNLFLAYDPENDRFYRFYGYVENAPNYNVIIYNAIFVNVGYWLNSYWQEMVSSMPFAKILFILCGGGAIYIGLAWLEKLPKKDLSKMRAEECTITNELITNAKKLLKKECLVLVIIYSVPLLLGGVFFVWNHIIWGLLFYMMMFLAGILTGVVHPVARYKLYKKWAKEIKMQAIVKGTDVD